MNTNTATFISPLQGLRLLIVDDEEEITKALGRHFKRKGIFCVAAGSGEEAVKHLQNTSRPFDLLITDILMPAMDGLALARWVHGHYPEMPVLFMSAFGNKEIATREMRPGMDDYIAKPFVPDDLLQKITTVLQ